MNHPGTMSESTRNILRDLLTTKTSFIDLIDRVIEDIKEDGA